MHYERLEGFTLIEVLVVIIIISILATSLITAVFWVIDKAKINNTIALIDRLEKGVKAYAAVFGNRLPPGPPAFTNPIPSISDETGSQCLYFYLGFQHTVTEGHSQSNLNIFRVVGPFVDFKGSDIMGGVLTAQSSPAKIVDIWGVEIYYNMPGVNHIANGSGYKDNSAFVDIESAGPDMDFSTVDDNISNFKR